ncbi:hypothetical protein BDP27DRAFT_1418335 [Rhodocollybia butyracea]|uniref:Uncharacterized protein n=1 Tax=Rhodocollybia butyracea TaxID=206335 RepID=A0A9P5Q1D5_9AGAR|nr:hypothetical protein BDP27DRAFT_1418335 [Rhodocollybia butyracea]
MATFEYSSKLRAADSNTVINLTTKHCLIYGQSKSAAKKSHKSHFPPNLQVFPAPSIVFSFSAVLNRKPVPVNVLFKSQLTQIFVDFLRANEQKLGLTFVSNLYGKSSPKVNVVTNNNRQPVHDSIPVRVLLRTVHLQYSVTTKSESSDVNLFSTRLSLPYRSLADNLLKRFVTFHLVKKYPLVFGALGQQLDIEAPLFLILFQNIKEMAKRSTDPTFRSRVKQIFNAMKKQHQKSFISASTALNAYLNIDPDPKPDIPPITNEAAFCLSMEQLFLKGLRRTLFKASLLLLE